VSSTRLGRVARTISGSGFPPSEQGATSGDFPFVKVSDLALKANAHRVVDAANWVTRQQATALGARIVPSDSIVFPKVGAALLGNARGRTDIPLLIDNNMMAVVPTYLDTGFSYWWLRSVDMAQLSEGGTLPFVSDTAVRDLRVPVMSIDRQQRVADFLDDRVARIDQIIAARQQQVEALKSWLVRASFDAIRGLGPGATRESGLPWLGPIPIEWPVLTVSSEFQVDLGKMLDEKRQTGVDAIPYLRNTNVQWDCVTTDDLKSMDIESSERERYCVRPGDLLVCEGGQPGRAAIWTGDIAPLGFQKALHRVRSRGNSRPEWLLECLRVVAYTGVIASDNGQTTIGHLTNEQLRSLRLPFPPRAQQDHAIGTLRELQQHLQSTRKSMTNSMDRLAEYKQALITAAVTGELDVTTAGSGIPGGT
jgi:type I restriction enzyme S subunit